MNCKFKLHKNAVIPVVIMIVGLVLAVFGGMSAKSEIKDENFGYKESIEYINELERKLGELVSRIEGVGNVYVVITLKSGRETVYAQNTKNSGNMLEKNYVVVSGKETPVITVKEVLPQISGVGIVCDGNVGDVNKEKIISVVSTCLGIPTNKVYVTK